MTSFAIFAPDCDAYYYDDAGEELFCSSCGSFVSESSYYPAHLGIKSLKYNFCFTYDGQLLLSKQAKVFLESESSSQLCFHRVNSDPDIYVVETKGTVLFDQEKRKTRFVGHCSLCGNFESVVGSTPVFIKNETIIEPLSFVTTDLKFGSAKEKAPLYIVGKALGEKMKKAFKEIDLEDVREQ